MRKFGGKIVWITGASSGIGKEMARQANMLGSTVILSARREHELDEVRKSLPYPEKAMTLIMDMEKPGTFPGKVESVIKSYGRVDLLFNNAGISQRSLLRNTSLEVDRKIMEVNYFGTVALTRELLPYLRKQKESHIAVTSSLAGKFGFYLRSAYSASKFALHGFFETLALEEAEDNIKVTIFCPAGVQTRISQNALNGEGEKYGKTSGLQESGMPVEECVKIMIRAIEKNKKEVIIGQGIENISVKIKALWPSLFFKMVQKRKPADI